MFARRGALLSILAIIASGAGSITCTREPPEDTAPVATARGDVPIGAIGAVGADIPSASTSAMVEPAPPPPRKLRKPRPPADPFGAPELAPSDASPPAPKSEGTAL